MAEEKKKNPFQKLKEGLDDKEEQLAIISLLMMTLGYMGKVRIDGAFTAGLVSGVLGSYGISVGQKKGGTANGNPPKIVDNSKNKVGIK